jgi:hypothetical protein
VITYKRPYLVPSRRGVEALALGPGEAAWVQPGPVSGYSVLWVEGKADLHAQAKTLEVKYR